MNNLLDLNGGELLSRLIGDDEEVLPVTVLEATEGGEEEKPKRGRTHMTLQPNYDKAKWHSANPKQFLIMAHRILDSTRVFQSAVRLYSGRRKSNQQGEASSKAPNEDKESLLSKDQGDSTSGSICEDQRTKKAAEINQAGQEESKYSVTTQAEEKFIEEAPVPAMLESTTRSTEPRREKRDYVLEFPETKTLLAPQFLSIWWLKRAMVVATMDVLPSLFLLELDLSIKMLHRTLQEVMTKHGQPVSVAPEVREKQTNKWSRR